MAKRKSAVQRFEDAVNEMIADGFDAADIVELAAGEATGGLEAADIRSRMYKSPDNPLEPARGGQPLRGGRTTGATPLRAADPAVVAANGQYRSPMGPVYDPDVNFVEPARGPAPDIERLRGGAVAAPRPTGPVYEPEIDAPRTAAREGRRANRRARLMARLGFNEKRIGAATVAARGMSGRAAAAATRTAAAAGRMGLGGLLGAVAPPALAAFTAYEVGKSILDATEGRDQEVRTSRALGLLGLQEGVSEDIDVEMLRAESAAARGMAATERMEGSLAAERRAYIAEELGSVLRDRGEEIAQMQYVSGPSPLEVQATMQSLLR